MELLKQWKFSAERGDYLISICRRTEGRDLYAEYAGPDGIAHRVFLEQPRDGHAVLHLPATTLLVECLSDILKTGGSITRLETLIAKKR